MRWCFVFSSFPSSSSFIIKSFNFAAKVAFNSFFSCAIPFASKSFLNFDAVSLSISASVNDDDDDAAISRESYVVWRKESLAYFQKEKNLVSLKPYTLKLKSPLKKKSQAFTTKNKRHGRETPFLDCLCCCVSQRTTTTTATFITTLPEKKFE